MSFRLLCSLILAAAILLAQDSNETPIPYLLTPAEDTVIEPLRKARGKTFNPRSRISMITPDSLQPPLGPFKIVDYLPLPGLPLDEGDTVLVGEITCAQPFLSLDEKGIYTEFTLNAPEAIKNVPPAGIAYRGTKHALLSEGGAARLPDGSVIRHVITNAINPVVGEQYLLFLLYRPDLEAFRLLKMWHIDDGVLKALYPQDQARVHHGKSKYQGMPEAEAIAALRSQLIP